MSTTYLLLRNNKQSGPHTLQALLALALQPHDLVWVEGESAGWRYPSEVAQLKSQPAASNTTQEKKAADALQLPTAFFNNPSKQTSHIYVSLPAGSSRISDVEPQALVPDLEAKAEALYQRTQAYLASHKEDDPETRYSRSLSDMKDAYGSWLITQKKKQKTGKKQKALLVGVTALLFLTASFFSYRAWRTPALNTSSTASLISENQIAVPTIANQPSNLSYASKLTAPISETPAEVSDAFNISTPVTRTAVKKEAISKGRKSSSKLKDTLASRTDTVNELASQTTKLPMPVPVTNTTKNTVSVSRLVLVSGSFGDNGKGKNAEIFLQNNSTESLKAVSVNVSYFRKNEKEAGRETVTFYNVAPGAKATIQAVSNRRASALQLQVGTITRADGSLYLVH